MTTPSKPLPCPWCGEDGDLLAYADDYSRGWKVVCPGEHCYTDPQTAVWESTREAVHAWNSQQLRWRDGPPTKAGRYVCERVPPFGATLIEWVPTADEWMNKHIVRHFGPIPEPGE